MIEQVLVRKGGLSYVCMPVDDFRFKCGKCLTGNIWPKKGETCRVCKAKVHRVAKTVIGNK